MSDHLHSGSPLSHSLLSREVASFIRQEIVGGRLRPDERLVEASFAERLKISKSPVREALRILEGEGLVVSYPHRGSFVVQLDTHDLWELDSLRSLVEPFAAQLAANNIDADGIKALEDLVAAMGSTADELSLSELHTKFHKSLALYSGHKRIIEIVNGLWSKMDLLLTLTHFGYLGKDQVQNDHRALLEAIKEKDSAKIRSRFEEHLNRTLPGLMDALRQKQV